MTPDEKLMLQLLSFATDDYVEDWATQSFVRTVKRACRRLGVRYSPYGTDIMLNIAERLIELEGATP